MDISASSDIFIVMVLTNNTQLEAKFFKGLADKSRLSILETLLTEPRTVSEVVEQTGLSQPNVSMHLSCLLECGLVERTKDGREVIYEISDREVISIISSMRKLMKKTANKLENCERYQ